MQWSKVISRTALPKTYFYLTLHLKGVIYNIKERRQGATGRRLSTVAVVISFSVKKGKFLRDRMSLAAATIKRNAQMWTVRKINYTYNVLRRHEQG